MTKCKDCLCDCHCNVSAHSDANGVCACEKCNCNPQGIKVNNDECLSCQQTKKKLAICIPKKKKNQVHVVKQKTKKKKQRSEMNKLYLVLALLFALSACSVGKKCTYTQDGTKLTSYVWFYNGDKPIDLDKNNCNQDERKINHGTTRYTISARRMDTSTYILSFTRYGFN